MQSQIFCGSYAVAVVLFAEKMSDGRCQKGGLQAPFRSSEDVPILLLRDGSTYVT